MRLALIQPPIWGNLRTPWEIAYVKSFVEGLSAHEVRTFDLAPVVLPLVEALAEEVRVKVDDSFATECYLSSLGFVTSIAETYLIRLFLAGDDERSRVALRALLATKTHHRGESLERLTDVFEHTQFFRRLDQTIHELCVAVADGGYDYIGCTTHITSYGVALWTLKTAKAVRPDLMTVLSGYQASMMTQETMLRCPWVDFVVRGESEGGYLAILAHGLRKRQAIDQQPLGLSMDEMPPPDYRDLDLRQYRMISIMASRNCPYGKCVFCQEDSFWSKFRFRHPEKLVDDMELLYERHGEMQYDLVDLDIRDFAVELASSLRRRHHRFRWSGAMRAETSTEAVLGQLRDANCRSIFFGFESGSQRLLHHMRKNITPSTLEQTLRASADAGIRAKLTCIAGLPTETRSEFEMTLDFVRRNAKYIRIVLVQCFKVLTRSPIGTAIGGQPNPYGLRLQPVPELAPVADLLYSMHYEGVPSPEEAMSRFVEARGAFRDVGVDERATLLSTNPRHQRHMLGLR